MATSGGQFSATTVETLAKRAAMLCSNPECGAVTSGPTSTPTGSVNIGEAAHIYGRTGSSARYTPDFTKSELSDITNAIWLCRICHKLIDNDPSRFPPDLLFEWRRQHEAAVLVRLGRPSDQLRAKVEADHLRLFNDTSYLAQEIIRDKPRCWEYKLTVEILRSELGPVHERWQHLKQGLYVRKSTIIPVENFGQWWAVKCADASNFVSSLTPIVDKLNDSWGPPGVPGSTKEIVTACRLLVSAASNFLDWEEEVRFSHTSEKLDGPIRVLQGACGRQLEQVFRIPIELSESLDVERPPGAYLITLQLSLPEGFADDINAAFARAKDAP